MQNPQDISDEAYVINICDRVLRRRSRRQHRFDFLRGDTGRRLPVDAYYPSLSIVVEYLERQHFEDVSFFDKPTTASGISRKAQRRRYDLRRRRVLPRHGIGVIVFKCTEFECDRRKRLLRNKRRDIEVVRKKLRAFAA